MKKRKGRAFIYVRKTAPYPHFDIWRGLEKCGYGREIKYLTHFRDGDIMPWDLLVTWTLWRHTTRRNCADAHTRIRGTTFCMEHGWIKNIHGKEYYQLAVRRGYGPGMNGAGDTVPGDGTRWKSWKLKLEPWRKTGSHVLVCMQRGVRPQDPDITHGPEWANIAYDKIKRYTDRPIHWRPHPGNHRPCLPSGDRKPDKIIDPFRESMAQNLKDAWCVVIYSSTVANEAIISGIPVLFDGQSIMLQKLAKRIKHIEDPFVGDRTLELEKCAWAQWNNAELSSGLPFKRLLDEYST